MSKTPCDAPCDAAGGRLEDARLLTGKGQFTADLVPSNACHVAFVRSDFPHGNIISIDREDALALPGVIAIYTADDLIADGVKPLICDARFDADLVDIKHPISPPRHALALDRVRFVGEAIAMVVADTAQSAADAADLVVVDIDALPHVVEPEAAATGEADDIWAEAPGNIAFVFNKGRKEETDSVFERAQNVVAVEFVNNRVTALPLEPRAGIAQYDAKSDSLSLLATVQGVHGVRNQLAEQIFDMPRDKLRVHALDVGGGFGLKNFVYPEWVALLWAAKKHEYPLSWIASRSEEMQAAAHGRDLRGRVELALDAQAKFIGLRVSAVANMGAYMSGGGPNVSTRALPTAFGGVYNIPTAHLNVRGVFTNSVPVDAYRGAGKPEANYLLERAIDRAASQLGIGPLSLRKQNIIDAMPYTSVTGTSIDALGVGDAIDKATIAADVGSFAERREEAKQRGRLRGLGVGCFLETSRGTPSEGASVRFVSNGRIEIALGTESNGQGHETTFSQLAASRFGVDVARIDYVQADTGRTEMGHGHGGARSMHMGGGALVGAMDAAIANLKEAAGSMLQTPAEQLEFRDGEIGVAGGGQSVSLDAVLANAEQQGSEALVALGSFYRVDDAQFTFPNGCHIAELEVDPQTGVVELCRYVAIDDYGVLLDAELTRAQVVGGLVQGIGQALTEVIHYDADSGQLTSGSLMDYTVPRASDLPPFEVDFVSSVTHANPLGVKGSGQAGAIAAPQTIVNGVLNALAPIGVTELDMPLTSEQVWRAINSAK